MVLKPVLLILSSMMIVLSPMSAFAGEVAVDFAKDIIFEKN